MQTWRLHPPLAEHLGLEEGRGCSDDGTVIHYDTKTSVLRVGGQLPDYVQSGQGSDELVAEH
jgi:hypothetical protein